MPISQQVKKKRRLVLHIKTVLTKLARDLGIGPGDVAYALRRLHHEGLAFVTKTLPSYAKFAVVCCDRQQIVARSSLTSFEWSGGSPRFMRGFLLSAISGDGPSLSAIRQFCEYFYKASFGFTRAQLDAAEQKYVSVDKSIGYDVYQPNAEFEDEMRRNFENLFPELTRVSIHDVFSDIRPFDGPGSFAESENLEEQYGVRHEVFKKLPTKRIGSHPAALNALAGYFKAYPSSREALRGISEKRIAHLRFVPKDSRGPRVISKEPYYLLKSQMAVGSFLSRYLERRSCKRINFADQGINQSLAKVASISRSHATADLKDASDRVRRRGCLSIFRNSPALKFVILHCVSTHVKLPSGKIHRLRKLANMGSGVCFPVLALCVFLSAVTGLTVAGVPLGTAAKCVYVYGDDLIVPTQYFDAAVKGLENFGLALNRDKSFSNGFFRESCGADYYHGFPVNPVRFRLSGEKFGPVADYRNGHVPVVSDSGLLQLERHCRELVDAKLLDTARFLYRSLKRRLPMPKVSRESNVLGIYDPYGVFNDFEPDTIGYVPRPNYATHEELCPHKLMSPFLRGGVSSGTDPYLIPLRYEVSLKKKKVLEEVDLHPYGLQGDPASIFGW